MLINTKFGYFNPKSQSKIKKQFLTNFKHLNEFLILAVHCPTVERFINIPDMVVWFQVDVPRFIGILWKAGRHSMQNSRTWWCLRINSFRHMHSSDAYLCLSYCTCAFWVRTGGVDRAEGMRWLQESGRGCHVKYPWYVSLRLETKFISSSTLPPYALPKELEFLSRIKFPREEITWRLRKYQARVPPANVTVLRSITDG